MLLLIESADWMEIPSNTIVCITPNMNVLSYPIVDEYHNDSYGTLSRNPDFAMRAGFHPSVVLHNPDSSVEAPNRIECWSDCSTKRISSGGNVPYFCCRSSNSRHDHHAPSSHNLPGFSVEPCHHMVRSWYFAGNCTPKTMYITNDEFRVFYVRIVRFSASSKLSSMKKELFETRQLMNMTSAQDEFSKWAKLRRRVDKLSAQVDEQSA